MRKLYMLIGQPGSGKSSYLKDENVKTSFLDAVVLSTDNYIEAIAKESGKSYNDVFKDNIKAAERFLQAELKRAIHEGKDIVWDQTNLNKNVRRKKMAQIPKHYQRIALAFETNPDILNKVNEERKEFGRAIPDNVIKSMSESYERPDKSEGFESVFIIVR